MVSGLQALWRRLLRLFARRRTVDLADWQARYSGLLGWVEFDASNGNSTGLRQAQTGDAHEEVSSQPYSAGRGGHEHKVQPWPDKAQAAWSSQPSGKEERAKRYPDPIASSDSLGVQRHVSRPAEIGYPTSRPFDSDRAARSRASGSPAAPFKSLSWNTDGPGAQARSNQAVEAAGPGPQQTCGEGEHLIVPTSHRTVSKPGGPNEQRSAMTQSAVASLVEPDWPNLPTRAETAIQPGLPGSRA